MIITNLKIHMLSPRREEEKPETGLGSQRRVSPQSRQSRVVYLLSSGRQEPGKRAGQFTGCDPKLPAPVLSIRPGPFGPAPRAHESGKRRTSREADWR